MQQLKAPAKLTLSLRITGVRPDGYHLLDAEMVSVDLADTLEFSAGDSLEIVDHTLPAAGEALETGPGNLVTRALDLVGRRAAVRLTKLIPAGAGLGGGSADAAAVLRWAGCADLSVGARLGADVPFCMVGGRARVGGIGEEVETLPYVERRFLALLPPLSVGTAAAYRAWDEGARVQVDGVGGNDLEAAALAVVPALERWRRAFAAVTDGRPRLAGSGATWFVEDDDGSLAERSGDSLTVDGAVGRLLALRCLPGYNPPPP